jgi:tetratricopeptide (TPR) repeat protein
MVLELVAGRLIARHLGSSLYTWTAVIGVVLGGITIGNYVGGRIADRFSARKTLSTLFILSSLSCILVIIANNIVGEWFWLYKLSWAGRTFMHVALVFLIPSILLGTISPVVAKMALDQGMATGKTIGEIYAWGAAGSIAGTFVTGYYLIDTMGTIATIWAVAVVIILMGLLYRFKFPQAAVSLVLLAVICLAVSPWDWCEKAGAAVLLREEPNPNTLYVDETPYCHVSVVRVSENPDRREFIQDKLRHSEIVMGDLDDLKYRYEQIHAAITHRFGKSKSTLSTLVIGGGGYVFPRYIEKNWPGSRVDVAEIDPGVTQAAYQAFGLSRDTSINTITMDARNYVDDLLRNRQGGSESIEYDFIYEDALNDYCVPFQLTTREFNDKLAVLLGDDGIYLVELIDVFDSGLFLGAFVNTLEQTFPYVYVVTDSQIPRSARNTFVVAAAKRELDLENISSDYEKKKLELWLLSQSEIDQLKQKAGYLTLEDDYAPVENLLAPVVSDSARQILAAKYRDKAKECEQQGDIEKAIAFFESMIDVNPATSIEGYNNMAVLSARKGDLAKTAENFRNVLAYNETSEFKRDMSNIHYSLGLTLQKLGRSEEALAEFNNAAGEYQKALEKTPDSVDVLIRLGNTYAAMGDLDQAISCFEKSVNLKPSVVDNHIRLIQAFDLSGQSEAAIKAADKAENVFKNGQPDIAAKLVKFTSALREK